MIKQNFENSPKLNGLLTVYKERGMTSHDVVSRLRNILGMRKIGHMGTLDPIAEGLLLIGLGTGTKLNEYLSNLDKSYIADILVGQSSSTDDCEGEILQTHKPSKECFDYEFVNKILSFFIGKQMQVPPDYSAVKIAGKKAYKLSRQGEKPCIDPRQIEVYNAKLLEIFTDIKTGFPIWKVAFEVSKGTYIRSLARDIGRKLDCGAHIIGLLRDRIGCISFEKSIYLKELINSKSPVELAFSKLINPLSLFDVRQVNLDKELFLKVANGVKISFDSIEDRLAFCYNGKLKAIYDREDNCIFKARVVFCNGVFCE